MTKKKKTKKQKTLSLSVLFKWSQNPP
jgi:hypothetical protein